VQSEAAPAAYLTWKEGRVVEKPSRTLAEGLATGVPFTLPQVIMAESLSDFILVSDDELLQAMLWMIEKAHTLAEAAGAAPLAAAFRLREELAGLKVGLVCSGGNTTPGQLRTALSRFGESNQL
ncbi:MAG: pyridoxal-phosphate dependent enzyme, partial [Thermodesulfobacteriota bacterium]